jgi:serine protease AprX
MKWSKWGFVLIFLFQALYIYGQSNLSQGKYLIYFTDKANNSYSLENPDEFLSDRSIFRRIRQGIDLDSSDLPVKSNYVIQVENTGASIGHISKWFNAVLVECDSATLVAILSLPFVVKEERIAKRKSKTTGDKFSEEKFFFTPTTDQRLSGREEYGETWSQTSMLNAQFLHEKDFNGQGIWIGVFDAGFNNVDSMSAFKDLRNRGGILYTKDMVDKGNSVYDEHRHGTMVLSTIAARVPNQYRGMAIASSFLLFRTEDVNSETKLEEINWLAAAEIADSLGVDIISTSLTYKTFDGDTIPDYTPGDMDGRTTHIAWASVLAHRKGILCVTSAGNDGNRPWNTVGTPADSDSILTIGSVDSTGIKSKFSTFGPTADFRIKPDVMAMGELTAVVAPTDVIVRGNGTSFSGPIIAGFAACIWSELPELSNYELRDLIMSSSSQFQNPDTLMGFGIPDYKRIEAHTDPNESNELMKIYPNPLIGPLDQGNLTTEGLKVDWNPSLVDKKIELIIYSSNGRKIATISRTVFYQTETLNLKELGTLNGLYYFRLSSQLGSEVDKQIILN